MSTAWSNICGYNQEPTLEGEHLIVAPLEKTLDKAETAFQEENALAYLTFCRATKAKKVL
jgi:hypothetical protein